jgi:hypothetical protein
VVSNLRFIDLCDRGALRRVRLCLTTLNAYHGHGMLAKKPCCNSHARGSYL